MRSRSLLLLMLLALQLSPIKAVASDATAVVSSTTATAPVPGSCTSDNAPGTPKGAECRCSSSGAGAKCITVRGDYAAGVACWNKAQGETGGEGGEYCYWSRDHGCICQTA